MTSAALDRYAQRVAPAPQKIGQATAVEQSRAVAEVQAAVTVAQSIPRDMERVQRDMSAACGSLSLANRAFYAVPNRGQGPSVHLARELARVFGNFQYGVHELRRDDAAGESEIQAFAWDLQTNTRSTRTFINPHAKDTRQGRKPLTDLSDIYLNNQNTGAKAVRECIFSALPQWLVDDAEAACRVTLERGDGRPFHERARAAIEAFATLGVDERQLAGRVGRNASAWTPEDLAALQVAFQSIRRGETTVEEQFQPARVTAQDVRRPAAQPSAAAPPAPGPAAEPEQPRAPRKSIQRLQILMRAAGMTERDQRLLWVEEQVGHSVDSTNDLTPGEADLCVAYAEKLPEPEAPPEDPPDDALFGEQWSRDQGATEES